MVTTGMPQAIRVAELGCPFCDSLGASTMGAAGHDYKACSCHVPAGAGRAMHPPGTGVSDNRVGLSRPTPQTENLPQGDTPREAVLLYAGHSKVDHFEDDLHYLPTTECVRGGPVLFRRHK